MLLDLPYGTHYSVNEVDLPQHCSVAYSGNVVSANDASGRLTKDRAVDGKAIINTLEGGYELPSTGGPGTRIFTILGSVLILGAGVLLWGRRRLI